MRPDGGAHHAGGHGRAMHRGAAVGLVRWRGVYGDAPAGQAPQLRWLGGGLARAAPGTCPGGGRACRRHGRDMHRGAAVGLGRWRGVHGDAACGASPAATLAQRRGSPGHTWDVAGRRGAPCRKHGRDMHRGLAMGLVAGGASTVMPPAGRAPQLRWLSDGLARAAPGTCPGGGRACRRHGRAMHRGAAVGLGRWRGVHGDAACGASPAATLAQSSSRDCSCASCSCSAATVASSCATRSSSAPLSATAPAGARNCAASASTSTGPPSRCM